MARDEEVEKRDRKITTQKDEIDRKTTELQETRNQLKKLTQHLPPPNATPKKKGGATPFML